MYRVVTSAPLLALVLAACGASAPAVRDAAEARREARRSELARLHEAADEQRQAIRELEARLALSQAEARDLRSDADVRAEMAPRETVRIGAPGAGEDGWQEPETELSPVEAGSGDEGPRPVLTLYGTRDDPSSQPAAPLVLAPPPPGVPDWLPVAPLPGELTVRPGADVPPVIIPARPIAPSARREPARDDPAVAAYREALVLVRDRQYDQALPALEQFLRSNGTHPYAANATYWRGEVLYAQRKYRRALGSFERVVQQWPRGVKVADSLLKIGLCHLRMGDAARARDYFRQVQQQYPESVAARLASQEDAS